MTRQPAQHIRRQELRPDRTIGMVVAAVLVASALSLWIFKPALGFGSEPVNTAAVADQTSGHDHAVPATPIDASRAPSSGPISALDKLFLVKVRQADLWELPAGRFAQDNASQEPVKRAGLHLMEGHSRLDQMVREVAKALALPIPDKPTAEQQAWLNQLRTTRGAKFDKFFANQLRNSHGKVFVVVAKVRATTQNSVIRDLAIEADKQVADHMEVLEDTGLVEPGTFEDVAADVLK